MKVQHIMSTQVYAVAPKTPLKDLWKAIFKKGIHSVPVIDKKNKLLGIIAEEDLLKPLYPDYTQFVEDFSSASDFEQMEKRVGELSHLTAENIMNTRVIFTREDTPIMRALSRMLVRKVRQLPVLSYKDELIGVVTKGDIFDSLVRRHLMRSEDVREVRKNQVSKNKGTKAKEKKS